MITAVGENTIKPKISSPSPIDYTLDLLTKEVKEMPPNIEELVKESFFLAKELEEKRKLFLLTIRWGFYLHGLEQFDQAEKYYLRSLEVAKDLKDDKFITHAYSNLGLLSFRINKHTYALQYLFNALSTHTEDQRCFIYSNIGVAFFGQKKYEKALDYFQKALDSALDKDEAGRLNAYINTGGALLCLKRYEEAVPYYLQSFQIIRESGLYMNRKGACFENFGELRLMQKQYGEASEFLQKALNFYVEFKEYKRVSVCLRLLGEVAVGQQKYEEAYQLFQKSLSYTHEHQYVVEEKETLETIIEYCKNRELWQDCMRYQDELIQLQSRYFYPEQKEKVEAILNKQEEEIDILLERNLKIEEQNQILQQYNKELKQYAFIVAHDLKEPLCNITGFSTLLNSRYKSQLSEEVIELLQYIEGGAQYMHNLLEDLLKYTTLSVNKDKVKEIDTNLCLQKIVNQLQLQIETSDATIQIDSLPNIMIEPKHFQWLMTQLIENSLKFSHHDKPCHIYIHTYQRRNRQYIEVRDNGIGIEAEQQQKIFRIFQRLNKQSYEGTGIGLAICKKIVSLYNGEIGLQSREGEGTAVYFSLPSIFK